MVTFSLRTLRLALALLMQAALLLYAGAVQASAVQLAPGLEIELPSSLALDVIPPREPSKETDNSAVDDTAVTGPVLVGKVNGEPGYFIAAVKVKNWEKNNILWQRLETAIANKSNAGEFTVSQRGSFPAAIDDLVWYRAYEFIIADQTHRQVYFLINDRNNTYWITLTMVQGVDTNLAIPITKALIHRLRIVE